jgi:hypothetical protein
VPLAHACNPGYSGGSKQELMVQSKTLSQKKKPITKKGWWRVSKWVLSSNPSTGKKKKKPREKYVRIK